MHKALDQPLYFQGTRDTLAYAGVLPGRAGGGIYYFQLAVTRAADTSNLVLARVLPDPEAIKVPVFDSAEKSSLANGIAEVRFSYFGRDTDSNALVEPTWRQEWRDPNVLPLMIRIDVIPEKGAAWPSLVVEPRLAPEVGCRSWDISRNRCIGL